MSPGNDGAELLRGALDGAKRRSREWQDDQIRSTGFATGHAELGHGVIAVLRQKGYPLTVAHVAGQLAAVGTEYNWQGNARIASIVGRSERTVQRARARLEEDGLLSSYLLLTGDLIAGQRSPVRHPQVVRDVSRLQRLVQVRASERRQAPPRTGQGRRRPSAVDMPAPAPAPVEQEPMTAADFARLGEAHPEWSVYLADQAVAAAKRQRDPKPPPNAAHVTPDEIDEWDRVTAELERELRQRERDPPERGPPKT